MAADVTGFLFGNINSNWEVEGADDYLNKSGIQYLSKHLSEQQEELLSSADAEDSFGEFAFAFSNDDGTDYSQKASNAVDFSEIKLEEERSVSAPTTNSTSSTNTEAYFQELLFGKSSSSTESANTSAEKPSSTFSSLLPTNVQNPATAPATTVPANTNIPAPIPTPSAAPASVETPVEKDKAKIEPRSVLPAAVFTILYPPATSLQMVPELRAVCSTLHGIGGPILKYSEVFGPPPPSESLSSSHTKSKVDVSRLEEYIETDEEEIFHKPPSEPQELDSSKKSSNLVEIGLPLKQESSPQDVRISLPSNVTDYDFCAFEQHNWEDKIAWNSDNAPHVHNQQKPVKLVRAIIPTITVEERASKRRKMDYWELKNLPRPVVPENHSQKNAQARVHLPTFRAITTDLKSGQWIDSIIWDDSKPSKAPLPTDLMLDPRDKFYFPPEQEKSLKVAEAQVVPIRRGRKRKTDTGYEEGMDVFNLSNDAIYREASAGKVRQKLGRTSVIHSAPALKLAPYKTILSDDDLANFHRPKLKIKPGHTYRISVYKAGASRGDVNTSAQSKEMRHKGDLSAREGRVILLEYMEENPLIIANVGMGTKIKNIYRKRNPNENPFIRCDDGENIILEDGDDSPFLGDVEPGKTVQAVDNNIFLAPIHKHPVPNTDFLLVKIGQKWYIREVPAIYTVGQQLPKMEVYAPNSRAVPNYQKNRLHVYLYRQFMERKTNTIRISELLRQFPGSSEQVVRKKLKDFADFQRGGEDNGQWTVKEGTQLPSEEELRTLVTPEHVCLFESMMAGQYRLHNAGVNQLSTATPAFSSALQKLDEDKNADEQMRKAAHSLEEEVLLTPWNLTSNFVSAVHEGKGMLQLSGLGDPFGARGEGYSYLRVPIKNVDKKKKEDKPKVQVTGTDADLRKLSLEGSRLVLLKFGISEDEIQRMGRWERIGLVRKLSTNAVVSGSGGAAVATKFARGNRFSLQQQQSQYKEQMQMIFEEQLRMLSTPPKEEDDDSSDEGLLDDFEKELENTLASRKRRGERMRNLPAEPENEKEEFEKLMKDAREEDGLRQPIAIAIEAKEIVGAPDAQLRERAEQAKGRPLDAADLSDPVAAAKQIILRKKHIITREDGTKEERVELISDPRQIEAYLTKEKEKERKVRTGIAKRTRQLSKEEEEEKTKIKKEKRRLQEQLRRLRKNREKQEEITQAYIRGEISEIPGSNQITCSACGMPGHMRNNKLCPLYAQSRDQFEDRTSYDDFSDDDLIEEHPELVTSSGLMLKIRKDIIPEETKRDLNRNRRRRKSSGAALISLSSIFEKVMRSMKSCDVAAPFLKPVDPKDPYAPDYYQIISHPMDLSTMRDKVNKNKYESSGEFMTDVMLMRENCYRYNQNRNDHLLPMVDKLVQIAKDGLEACKNDIVDLEKLIAHENEDGQEGELDVEM